MRDDKDWLDRAEDLLFKALLDSIAEQKAADAKLWAETLGKLGLV